MFEDEDGLPMEVGCGRGVITVSVGSVPRGGEPSGVEACSVANRSGPAEGAGRPKLHASIKNKAARIKTI